MVIGFFCFLIFLFTSYQLAKDDFIFMRKNVSTENIFNIIFLGLPIVLLSSRILYIFLHFNSNYINPLVFFAVPYFPGLSLVGGVSGAWIFVYIYTKRKKMPTARILDMLATAFLLSVSIGICIQGVVFLFGNRLLGIEEIGRSMLGIALSIFALLQFLKSKWQEGMLLYGVLVMYCLLTFLSLGFMKLSRANVSVSQLVVTGILFLVSLLLLLYKGNPLNRLVRK